MNKRKNRNCARACAAILVASSIASATIIAINQDINTYKVSKQSETATPYYWEEFKIDGSQGSYFDEGNPIDTNAYNGNIDVKTDLGLDTTVDDWAPLKSVSAMNDFIFNSGKVFKNGNLQNWNEYGAQYYYQYKVFDANWKYIVFSGSKTKNGNASSIVINFNGFKTPSSSFTETEITIPELSNKYPGSWITMSSENQVVRDGIAKNIKGRGNITGNDIVINRATSNDITGEATVDFTVNNWLENFESGTRTTKTFNNIKIKGFKGRDTTLSDTAITVPELSGVWAHDFANKSNLSVFNANKDKIINKIFSSNIIKYTNNLTAADISLVDVTEQPTTGNITCKVKIDHSKAYQNKALVNTFTIPNAITINGFKPINPNPSKLKDNASEVVLDALGNFSKYTSDVFDGNTIKPEAIKAIKDNITKPQQVADNVNVNGYPSTIKINSIEKDPSQPALVVKFSITNWQTSKGVYAPSYDSTLVVKTLSQPGPINGAHIIMPDKQENVIVQSEKFNNANQIISACQDNLANEVYNSIARNCTISQKYTLEKNKTKIIDAIKPNINVEVQENDNGKYQITSISANFDQVNQELKQLGLAPIEGNYSYVNESGISIKDGSLAGWAIFLIVFSVLTVITLALFFVYYCYQRKTRKMYAEFEYMVDHK